MSTLKTNAIQTVEGKPILNSTGSILQVVNTNTVGQSNEVSTTSIPYVPTGFSVSITPISASSKLFVQYSGNIKCNGGDGVAIKIYRDGLAINPGAGDQLSYIASVPNNKHQSSTINHYVPANSTATTTFSLYFTASWSGTVYVSRDWGLNQFTVWEISG